MQGWLRNGMVVIIYCEGETGEGLDPRGATFRFVGVEFKIVSRSLNSVPVAFHVRRHCDVVFVE